MRMKTNIIITILISMGIAIVLTGCTSSQEGQAVEADESYQASRITHSEDEIETRDAEASTEDTEEILYACPMQCTDETFTDPEARCPVCGMRLVPVDEIEDFDHEQYDHSHYEDS